MMRYIHNTLLSQEKIMYWCQPHWIVFAPAAFAATVTLWLVWFGGGFVFATYIVYSLSLYKWAALISLGITMMLTGSAYITHQFSEFGITDKRVLMKTGWIRRNSLEIFLDKIEAIHVMQSIPGRILGYGTTIIVGTGGTQDRFFYIPDPLKFRKVAQQQIDADEKSRKFIPRE